MIRNIIGIGSFAGVLYCAYRSGQELSKAIPAQTQGEMVRNLIIAGAMGFGIGCAAPITGPIGIGWAAYDVYKNREAIKEGARALCEHAGNVLHRRKRERPNLVLIGDYIRAG